ncbi:imidazole glycerol phosphate synthase subunit HisH [Pseudomonas sp. NyZ704]|nr:imidazole glycerol phosphate synthase subunit HisH [Pseudomonas sp. NyZ704]
MIVVIDYGAGNIASVMNMLQKIGASAKVSNNPDDIAKATKLILPGVGAFDAGMTKLEDFGLIDILDYQVKVVKKPILGICLGAQMLGRGSEEGKKNGLGWIDMEVVKFEPRAGRKVPHMGWNYVKSNQPNRVLEGLDKDSRFYFVHSYYMQPHRAELTLLYADYNQQFCAGIVDSNILGFQFHPEKSHKFGMQILKNFAEKF